jgi:FlaA1/EpsC-like NDP-sugar epimerase
MWGIVNKTKTSLLQRIKSILENLGYLPRWIILGLDLFIVGCSYLMTVLLLRSLNNAAYDSTDYSVAITFVLLANLFSFGVFRTYSGLVRHSGLTDALRLFKATTLSLVLLLTVNVAYHSLTGSLLFLIPGLWIMYALSFSLLFLFRLSVKFVFDSYLNLAEGGTINRAVIIGTDRKGIAAANALKTETPRRFKLVGFVDVAHKNTHKTILDLPILNTSRGLMVVLRKLKVRSVVLADDCMDKESKMNLVDELLQNNFQVYATPLISDWKTDKELSKRIKSIRIEDLLERDPIQLDNPKISRDVRDKVVMVTGGAGSIGSELVRQLARLNPACLLILDQAESPLHAMDLEINEAHPKLNVVSVVADVSNQATMEEVFEQHRPQIIYHAAAYKHVPLMERHPARAIQVNVRGTQILADLAVQYEVERFVMVSTDKAVNPSNVMGASKRIAEIYVQSLHEKLLYNHSTQTKFITTRFGNVLGSNGSVVPLFAKQIESGGPITLTHRDIIRYFMTIPEACQLVLEAGSMGEGGEIYIFDMGKPVKIWDLAEKMIRMAGYTPHQDILIQEVGLRPGEKLYEELLTETSQTLPTYHEKILISNDRSPHYDQVKESVQELLNRAAQGSKMEMVEQMKIIVPEFKSMNSIYARLDQNTEKAKV